MKSLFILSLFSVPNLPKISWKYNFDRVQVVVATTVRVDDQSTGNEPERRKAVYVVWVAMECMTILGAFCRIYNHKCGMKVHR
jgi:hypothetical protein